MLTATQHQRIDRYLDELAGALGGLPASERDDLVAGVREHIQAALADRPEVTDADTDEVLRALGDPLAIAAEATGDDGVRSGPAGAGNARAGSAGAGSAGAGSAGGSGKRPLPQRDWVPAAVVVLLAAAPLVLPVLAMVGGFFALPVALIAGWVLLWVSPLWTPGEKTAGTFLLPALGIFWLFALVGAVGTTVCSGSMDSDGTVTSEVCTSDSPVPPVVAWILLAVFAVATVVTAVVLQRNGRRRATALAQSFSTGA
ncbi:Uncharacterized membrane protein [Jiangella alba]|uniref:Uncharacterized membrane protein n=2 Tax=Jiangella alba TaxID=561176 RepID=A0A1H5P2U9_9ACTN|nr:Uncharacterized membrane protein [Jiangella alba]